MNESKRTKAIYIRVCPEFLKLCDMMSWRKGESISTVLHQALSTYSRNYYTGPEPLAKLFELADIVGNTDSTPRRRKIAKIKKP